MSYQVSPIHTKACGVTSSTTQAPTSASWYKQQISPREAFSIEPCRAAWKECRRGLEEFWERKKFLERSSYINPFSSPKTQLRHLHHGLPSIYEEPQKLYTYRTRGEG